MSNSPQKFRSNGFLFSSDPKRIDVVHGFLTNCYWAKGVPRDTVARSIRHSLCFGVYQGRKQIGFARVISDYATFAYIGDVFILDEYRGRGLSKRLMDFIKAHPDLQNLRRWSLVTRDAHGLYSKFGFGPLKSPARHMEIHDPNVYKRKVGRQRARSG